VQHIAVGFTLGLATWLDQKTCLSVKLAELGESARAGVVYIAPDRSQMGITSHGRLHLSQEVTEEGFCPSVSYLFQSVACSYGRSAMGILLTGMGRDGAQGLWQLRQASGVTIAQNEATSVVFGMPGEAIRLGAAEHVLSPSQIVEMIHFLGGG
jgi:two-component system chemotaxis response regulator CheB